MASISKAILKKEIHDILENADLSVISAKKVRLQLQEKLKCDLLSRKDEIDDLVMDFVNSKEAVKEEESEEEDDEKVEEKSPVKRRAPPAKKPTKKVKKSGSGSDNDDDKDSGEEYRPKKTRASRSGKKKSSTDGEPKKAAAKGKGKRGTGFTRAYKLSPELASFMGAEEMPRYEVVKKMWAVIKERNLLDPKNKQFAICDPDLHKIMGVKKFRTFGMLKYLESHFIN